MHQQVAFGRWSTDKRSLHFLSPDYASESVEPATSEAIKTSH